MLKLKEIDSLQKAYAAHNTLHREYAGITAARGRYLFQENHEAVVRQMIALGGRHLLKKDDALDDTLSQDLREAFRLRYVSDELILAEDGATSSRVQILRTGTFHHPVYGKFTITEAHLDNMVNNFGTVRPVAPTEMVVDYEHMSVSTPPVKAEAAGWFKGMEKVGNALWAVVEWTADAIQSIKDKKYRFISPEFNLHYMHKETGKDVGATVVSAALTNRPFLEGMEPVALTEGAMLFAERITAADASYNELESNIRSAYANQFTSMDELSHEWVIEVYTDYCIIDKDTAYYKLPYSIDAEGNVTFDTANEIKVERVYQPMVATDDLPDECFALLMPGGEKDTGGNTVPRSLRRLPYKGVDDKVDLILLRSALTQMPQLDLSTELKDETRAILMQAAKVAGVDEYGVSLDDPTKLKEELKIMKEELLRLLGLSDGKDDDILEAVKALKALVEPMSGLKAELKTAQAAATAATKELGESARDKVVTAALSERKITPKMKGWAEAYALRDPEGFAQYINTAEIVGPELGEKGVNEAVKGNVQLTDVERKVAKTLNLTEDDMLKAKQAAMTVEEQASSA